jgi:hypothetical protein
MSEETSGPNRDSTNLNREEDKVIVSSFDKNALNQNLSETKKTVIEKLEEKAAKNATEEVEEEKEVHPFSKEIFQYDYEPLDIFPEQIISKTDFVKHTQKETALSTLENLVTQFERPAQYVRELVQNSIDANASEINFNYAYDPDQQLSQLVISDDGFGMSYKDIKKYLLNLFESSKYENRSKIGKFGIGFVSLFAVDPDLVVVETTQNNKTYSVFLDTPKNGAGGKIIEHDTPNKDSGTTIRIFKKQTEYDFQDLSQKSLDELNYSCSHITKPLFFNEEKLNQEFEIKNAHRTIRFGNRGIEGVIGLVPKGKETYRLYNNRLLIKSGQQLKEDGLSFIVSSKDLSPNLSRNDLLQDNKYHQIIKLLGRETSKLAEKVFEQIAYLTANPPENRRGGFDYDDELKLLWNFANDYVSRTLVTLKQKADRRAFKKFRSNKKLIRDLPKPILDSKVFKSLNGKLVSITEVLDSIEKEKSLLYDGTTRSRIVRELLAQDKLILKCGHYYTGSGEVFGNHTSDRLLFKLDPRSLKVSTVYSLPNELPLDKLNDEEQSFLKTARAWVENSPLSKYVSQVYIGDFSDDWGFKQLPFKFEYRTRDGSHQKYFTKREESKKILFSEKILNKAPFIINRHNDYFQGLLDQVNNPDSSRFAYVNLLSLMASSVSFVDKRIIPKVHDYMQRYMQ